MTKVRFSDLSLSLKILVVLCWILVGIQVLGIIGVFIGA